MKEQNLKQQAYEYLKTRILNCEITPGEYINEKDVLEEVEIGRTPFREAVIMLQAEHLVEVRPRHGTFATKLTRNDVNEVFNIRKMFEPIAVFHYLNLVDMSKLIENDRLMAKLSNEADVVPAHVLCETDMAFHSFFIESSGNERLIRLFKPVLQDAYRISMFNNWFTDTGGRTWKDTYVHHHQILEAILTENKEEITRAYNVHLNHYLASALLTIELYEKDQN